jgi:hypothetical protein
MITRRACESINTFYDISSKRHEKKHDEFFGDVLVLQSRNSLGQEIYSIGPEVQFMDVENETRLE